jgi:hypothetical protein
MNRTIAICLLIVSLGAIICTAVAVPHLIDDTNGFLRAFVGHEFLSILGVFVAITLASASQIHLKFNEIEEKAKKRILIKSRQEVASSAYWLIAIFLMSLVLVLSKPWFCNYPMGIAIINGLAIWFVLINILILFDITAGIFSIPPDITD